MELAVDIIPELKPFLLPQRYKVAYGGRGSSKSWGIARLLLIKAYTGKEKILCCRELQTSISESVLTLLSDQITLMGLDSAFEILRYKITCLTTGSEFIFEGLASNVTKIKSMEGLTYVWAEEAEKISKESWDVLIPTVRRPGSEIWISFNPDDDLDETYQRFVIDPPPNSYVVKIDYHQNPWFPDVLREEMEYLKSKNPEEYKHVWEGFPRVAIEGAYYAKNFIEIYDQDRIRNVPHDSKQPVITAWDLGMADSTVVWFAQVNLSEVRIINCLEFKGTGLPDIINEVMAQKYRYSQHIAPHDIAVREFGSGVSRLETASDLGIEFTVAPRLSVDDGIEAVKMMLPNCYFDRDHCSEGIKALKRYKTEYNARNKVFNKKPLHDWTSDYADAFRYLAITPHETGFSDWGKAIEYKELNYA